AFKTRSRICGDNPLTLEETFHACAHRHDIARQLVSKKRGRYNHASVISTPVNLDVGAAGEGGSHTHQHVSSFERRNSHGLDLELLFAIEHCRDHLVIHFDLCG